MLGTQPMTPTIVREVPPVSHQTQVVDLLLGTVGMVGAIMIAALLAGLLAGWLFIKVRSWRDRHDRVPESHVRLEL